MLQNILLAMAEGQVDPKSISLVFALFLVTPELEKLEKWLFCRLSMAACAMASAPCNEAPVKALQCLHNNYIRFPLHTPSTG